MSNSTTAPCPYCECKTTNLKGSGKQWQRVCTGCGAEGPTAETPERAEILWDRRPTEDYWKRVAAYLGSIHGANAMEYTAKSVSHSRRERQIGILQTVANALLRRTLERDHPHGTTDEKIKWAGERAESEREELIKIGRE